MKYVEFLIRYCSSEPKDHDGIWKREASDDPKKVCRYCKVYIAKAMELKTSE